MNTKEILRGIRPRLSAEFGPRLKDVVLYGSEARGEAVGDSDIDILVVLSGPLKFGNDLTRITETLYPLQLDIADRPLHAVPAAEEDYVAGEYSLYRQARQEGVSL
jgi:predicted nucleotidyltransferase